MLNRFKIIDRSTRKMLNERVWFLDASTKLRRATISFVASVRPSAWNNSATTGQTFMKFVVWIFYENLSSKFKFYENLTRITSTLHEDQHAFFIISRLVLLRMRNFSSKVVGKIKTHFMFNNFHCKLCRFWDNVEKYHAAGQDTWQ